MDQLLVILFAASVAAQDYGPVSLDSVDALTLNWNQIHWLVKDQIKEVEELREEHNELYNEITRCFGNEKCLAEFELLDMSPGSKLHGLGLRALDLSGSAMTRMREEVLQTKARLDMEMRERWTMDKKFILDTLERRILFLVILVNLILLILTWHWRWTSSGSNVLWSELSDQQWAALLQCQHHLWTNAYCLRAQI